MSNSTKAKQAKQALDDWPEHVNPKYGLGPMDSDVGIWFAKHVEIIYETLVAQSEVVDVEALLVEIEDRAAS